MASFSALPSVTAVIISTSASSLALILIVVEFKENQRAGHAGPLVPVHEEVVPGDVEEIGRGHLEQVALQETPPNPAAGMCGTSPLALMHRCFDPGPRRLCPGRRVSGARSRFPGTARR